MMFVYHYVIIPFHPQYLPRHAPQGGGCQRGGCWWPKTLKFSLLQNDLMDDFGSKIVIFRHFQSLFLQEQKILPSKLGLKSL